ncbi:MAG: hydantoinase/oxoprolinase family protein, partial [Bauldia litoralis]
TVDDGFAQLDASGVPFEARRAEVELDMSYIGQTHTVAVPLDVTVADGASGISRAAVQAAFDRAYKSVYGRLLDNVAVRVLNLRVAVIGVRPSFDFATLQPDASGSIEAARTGTRPVWADGAEHEAAIYARLDLPVGAEIAGPAILEQADTTIFVDPDLTARIDHLGNVVIARKEHGA